MRHLGPPARYVRLLPLAALLFAAALPGCPRLEDDACSYDGRSHEAGATFPSTDGCNSCSCLPSGEVACTLKACAPAADGGVSTSDASNAPALCRYGGQSHPIGARFPSSDGCNDCSYGEGGAVACTERACAPRDGGGAPGCLADGTLHPVGARDIPDPTSCNSCICTASGLSCTEKHCPICRYEGQSFAAGTSFPSVDGCNSCSCTADRQVVCTLKACEPLPRDGGAAPGVCSYGGQTHPAGASFPSTDGCNECTCGAGGVVGCTKKACQGPCAVAGAYEWGSDGGRVAYRSRSHLLGGRAYKHERIYLSPAPPVAPLCAPDLPACGDAKAITPREVQAAIADADVQKALAAARGSSPPPFFGHDQRPVDGPAFEFKRVSDGARFLVGAACTSDLIPPQSACVPIPAGIARLQELLRALDQQQLATKSCKAAFTN